MRPHTKGLLITLSGSLCFAPDALLIRLTDLESFTYAMLRGFMMAAGVTLFLVLAKGRGLWPALRRIGRIGVLAALLNGGAGILFIFAFAYTSAANVLLYIAVQPFIAAVLSRLLIGERISRSVLLAMCGAVVGIGIVIYGEIGKPSLIGDGAALLSATLFAAYFALLRKRSDVDMVPGVILAGLFNGLLAIPFMFLLAEGLRPLLEITADRWGWIAISGVMLPLALSLTTIGPRYLPAAEVNLLILLETVLGPLIVWAVLDEVPADTTLIGGAVVIGALLAHTLWNLRRPDARTLISRN